MADRTQYGTREDEALAPYLAEPCQVAAPSEFRRQQLRSSLRVECLLEDLLERLARIETLCVPRGQSAGSPSISPVTAAPVAPTSTPKTIRRPGGAS